MDSIFECDWLRGIPRQERHVHGKKGHHVPGAVPGFCRQGGLETIDAGGPNVCACASVCPSRESVAAVEVSPGEVECEIESKGRFLACYSYRRRRSATQCFEDRIVSRLASGNLRREVTRRRDGINIPWRGVGTQKLMVPFLA